MKRTMTLTRIGIRSAVLRICMVSAASGFVLGAVASLWTALLASSFTLLTGIDATRFGIAMVALLPIAGAFLLGIAGALSAFLFVLLYNLTAGLFGGIRVEYEEEGEKLTNTQNSGKRTFTPSRRSRMKSPC